MVSWLHFIGQIVAAATAVAAKATAYDYVKIVYQAGIIMREIYSLQKSIKHAVAAFFPRSLVAKLFVYAMVVIHLSISTWYKSIQINECSKWVSSENELWKLHWIEHSH